jgi:hypothetical protein
MTIYDVAPDDLAGASAELDRHPGGARLVVSTATRPSMTENGDHGPR